MNTYFKYSLLGVLILITIVVIGALLLLNFVASNMPFSFETPSLDSSLNLSNVKQTNEVTLDADVDPLIIPTPLENGILYVTHGYSHDSEAKTVQAFYYDFDTKTVTQRSTIPDVIFTDACEGDSGILLSSDDGTSTVVRLTSKGITASDSKISCQTNAPMPADCQMGTELFRQLLPGSDEELSMCYNRDSRETSFHVITDDAEIVTLGEAGTTPGGSGRFVVLAGTQPGTYLFHHNRSNSPSAVMVDLNNLSVTDVDLPDLTAARPSMGFGAGNHGVDVHPIATGYLAAGHGGQAFLIQDNVTTLLADNVGFTSVAVTNAGCTATLIAENHEEQNAKVLREFTFCKEGALNNH